jgi:hypothetical protein
MQTMRGGEGDAELAAVAALPACERMGIKSGQRGSGEGEAEEQE